MHFTRWSGDKVEFWQILAEKNAKKLAQFRKLARAPKLPEPQTESDSEERGEENPHEDSEINQNPVKEESLTPQPNNNQAEEQKIQRRGERNRLKPNFYGHNIMVTQLSPLKEEEENIEKEIPKKKKSANNEKPPKEGKRYTEEN